MLVGKRIFTGRVTLPIVRVCSEGMEWQFFNCTALILLIFIVFPFHLVISYVARRNAKFFLYITPFIPHHYSSQSPVGAQIM